MMQININFNMQHLQEWKRKLEVEQQKRSHMIELSKLYNIYYAMVKDILNSSLQNEKYLIPKIRTQISKINHVLQYLNNENDLFVSKMKKINYIDQFKKQLQGLLQILFYTLQLQKNKTTISNTLNKRALSAIHFKKSENHFSLHAELKKSKQRSQKAKAGIKIQKLIPTIQLNDLESADIKDINQILKSFEKKRNQLQNMITKNITRKNQYQITFEKKYQNLGEYFTKRAQFSDCFLGEAFFKNKPKVEKNIQENRKQSNGPGISPFLTDLNVQIKCNKPAVKFKIQQALKQVKLRLINKYHQQKIAKFNEVNTDYLVELIESKKQKEIPITAEKSIQNSYESQRQHAKWTRQTGRTGKTKSTRVSRISTAHLNRYPLQTPIFDDDINQKILITRLKENSYR